MGRPFGPAFVAPFGGGATERRLKGEARSFPLQTTPSWRHRSARRSRHSDCGRLRAGVGVLEGVVLCGTPSLWGAATCAVHPTGDTGRRSRTSESSIEACLDRNAAWWCSAEPPRCGVQRPVRCIPPGTRGGGAARQKARSRPASIEMLLGGALRNPLVVGCSDLCGASHQTNRAAQPHHTNSIEACLDRKPGGGARGGSSAPPPRSS